MLCIMVVQGKLMREERGTTKMIKKSLYIEFASLRHYLIHLSFLETFVETWNT